jgi:hypothetical protein
MLTEAVMRQEFEAVMRQEFEAVVAALHANPVDAEVQAALSKHADDL